MNRALILLAAALCLLAIVGCGKDDKPGKPIKLEVALSDMVAFDRAYIPALELTNAGDAAKAKKAVALLTTQWQQLRAKYITAPGITPQWRADFDNINSTILTADRWLLDGKPPQEAHGVLEGVRKVLRDLRMGYSISYDLDSLTLFQGPTEAIALVVNGKTAEQLTANDWSIISEQFRYAEPIWIQIAKAEFDPALFQLTPGQDQKLREEIKQEAAVMDELDAALTAGDKARVFQAASALKPHFTAIYLLFGDFSALQ
jgi:hypothetical protein